MAEKKTSKIPKPKVRKRFIAIIEGYVPVKLHLQTFAEDENEALKQFDNPHLSSMLMHPELDLSRLKKQKITVKDGNTSLVQIVKTF